MLYIVTALALLSHIGDSATSSLKSSSSSTSEIPYTFLVWSHGSTARSWIKNKAINTPLGSCMLTQNTSLIAAADVVFFHWEFLGRFEAVEPVPLPRPTGTLWVYFSFESTARGYYANYPEAERLNGSINVMMTYERTSTLPTPYGRFYRKTECDANALAGISFTREKSTAILMSNCNSKYRTALIEKLRPLIDIDHYGRCSSLNISSYCESLNHQDCKQKLGKGYLFYLALENSECYDYITEKVWRNSFTMGMVPIVWSDKVDYKSLLPPRSYINVADFPSLAAFGEHINRLRESPELYAQYHEWRKCYAVIELLYGAQPGGEEKRLCEFAIKNARKELPPVDLNSRTCFQ